MCILFIAINQHPKYPLVVCANRDEFYQRPTRPMHVWKAHNLLAGQDELSGGTWLGINQYSQISALTNLRMPALYRQDAKSRGELVINALTSLDGKQETRDFIKELEEDAEQYNPFNLLFENNGNMYCFHSVSKQTTKLSPGFHSVCNGAIDDIWPKMATGTKRLEEHLLTSAAISTDELIALLNDTTKAPIKHLPDTGVEKALESELSSIFVQTAQYGTRSSSVLLRDQSGNCTIYEYQYSNQGDVIANQEFSLKQGQFSPKENR